MQKRGNAYTRLFSNTVVLTVGSILSKVLVFFLVPLYTYCLSTAQLGTADLLFNTANFLIPFACLGITGAVFRFAAGKEHDPVSVYSSGIYLLAVSSIVFLLLSPLLSLVPFFEGKAWLIVVYVLASNFHALASQFLRAEEKMTLFSVQGLCNTALVILFNLLFLLVFDMGIEGYVLSVVLADFAVGLCIFLFDRQWKQIHISSVHRDILTQMLKYSIPMIPASIFWWITNVSDRFFVTWLCGSDINGIYAVAYKIPTILTLLSGAFIDAWQLSSVSEGKTREEQSEFFTRVYRFFLSLMFLCGAALIPPVKLISSIMFHESYYTAWEYMPFLILSSVLTALVSFLGSVYVVKLKSVFSFWTSLVGAGANVALNAVLIPRWGALGAAVATAASYLCVYLIRAITVRKQIAFCLCPIRTALGIVILLLQSATVLSECRGWIWICAGLFALMFAVFWKPFFGGIGGFWNLLRKKS